MTRTAFALVATLFAVLQGCAAPDEGVESAGAAQSDATEGRKMTRITGRFATSKSSFDFEFTECPAEGDAAPVKGWLRTRPVAASASSTPDDMILPGVKPLAMRCGCEAPTAYGGYDGSAKPALEGFGYALQYLSTGEVRVDQYQLKTADEAGTFLPRTLDAG